MRELSGMGEKVYATYEKSQVIQVDKCKGKILIITHSFVDSSISHERYN